MWKYRMHALLRMPHTAEEQQRYTKCQRQVPRERVTADEAAVTCGSCLEQIRQDREWARLEARARNHAGV